MQTKHSHGAVEQGLMPAVNQEAWQARHVQQTFTVLQLPSHDIYIPVVTIIVLVLNKTTMSKHKMFFVAVLRYEGEKTIYKKKRKKWL